MNVKLSAIVFFIILCLTGLAFAHSGATGIVQERMQSMKDIGKHMKTIGEMIKGKTNYDAEIVHESALIISRHAAQIAPLFPANSTIAPSEASPEIWKDWNDFVTIADMLKLEALELSQIAKGVSNSEDIKDLFGKAAKTCTGCHKKYRLKR